MSSSKQDFQQLFSAIVDHRNLGEGLHRWQALADAHTELSPLRERAAAIADDYNRMKQAFRQGFSDPAQPQIYAQLLARLYRLAADSETLFRRRQSIFLLSAMQLTDGQDFSNDAIRQQLEAYVQDQTMLSLLPEDEQKQRKRDLEAAHLAYMKLLFLSILSSLSWREADRDFFADLLTSPLVAPNDVSVLLSAVHIACVNQFDINKLRVLLAVFEKGLHPQNRQRAYIGMLLSLSPAIDLYPDAAAIRQTLSSRTDVLIEFLRQVVSCVHVDADASKIKNDILPNLINGQKLGFRAMQQDATDETSLEEILHPEENEKVFDQMEESMRKMIDMQKSGADVYYGGFSQMKRFPFFASARNAMNWFLPFSAGHPEMAALAEDSAIAHLLSALEKNSPFCDSDKYSFAFSIKSVLDKLPAQMKDAFATAEAFGPNIDFPEHLQSHINSTYLRDVYRFYNLFMFRNDFVSPFSSSGRLQLLFQQVTAMIDLQNSESQVAKFLYYLYKRGYDESLSMLFHCLDVGPYPLLQMVKARHLTRQGQTHEALSIYQQLHQQNPADRQVAKSLARCAFLSENYALSEQLFTELLASTPDDRKLLYGQALSLLYGGKTDESVAVLFRLNYEYPDDDGVKLLLVRALLHQHRAEQALHISTQASAEAARTAEYLLLKGYAQLFAGNRNEALQTFNHLARQTEKTDGANLQKMFQPDTDLFAQYGFTETDMKVLADTAAEP